MKRSNKVLVGGFIGIIVLFIGAIAFISINYSTDDAQYQVKNAYTHIESNF